MTDIQMHRNKDREAREMDLQTIEFEVSDHVATITLNRPEAMNSFNNRMGEEMSWAWMNVRDTPDIHVAIVQANGARAFCTGADVKGGMDWVFKESSVWDWEDPSNLLSPKFHHRCWKPVVTAVHGMCAGGGMYFVIEADIVICSDDAVFFDPHADADLVSTVEAVGMLSRGVALGAVLRWALMGKAERLDAETALRLDLVSEITTSDGLRARAREIALSIAGRNPKAIQGSIKGIWESLDMHHTQALGNALNYTMMGNPYTTIHNPRRETDPS